MMSGLRDGLRVAVALAGLAVLSVAMPAVAQDPCVGCDGQMLNATIQSNITQGIYDDINRQNQRQLDEMRQNQAAPAGAAASSSIMDQVENTVMARLAPEFNRRKAADGQASANAWMVAAARAIGGQTGQLVPEYQRRVAASGQASADAWYVATADEISRRYVQDAH